MACVARTRGRETWTVYELLKCTTLGLSWALEYLDVDVQVGVCGVTRHSALPPTPLGEPHVRV